MQGMWIFAALCHGSREDSDQCQSILSGILCKYAQMLDNGLQSDETAACTLERRHVCGSKTSSMSEECLLSALALNLKRIVKALGQPPYLFDSTIIFQYRFCSKCFSQIIILILSTGPLWNSLDDSFSTNFPPCTRVKFTVSWETCRFVKHIVQWTR